MLPLLSKCNAFCRVFILVVIISIAVYFVYANEKQLYQKNKEGFSNSNVVVEQRHRKVIMQLYNELLLRDPQEFEVVKARAMMSHIDDTVHVVNAIRSSGEFNDLTTAINAIAAEKTSIREDAGSTEEKKDESDKASKTVSDIDLGQRMDTYRSIVKVYEKNLERLPNMKELNYYTYRTLTDTDFTLEKLEKILQSSQEYQILVMNQKNQVNAELPGKVTDAQLTLEVRKLYKSIFDEFPDREMEDFLKYKYVEYRLELKRLENLIRLLKMIDEQKDVKITATDKTKSETTTETITTTVTKKVKDLASGIAGGSGSGSGSGSEAEAGTGTGTGANGDSNSANSDVAKVIGSGKAGGNVFNIINPSSEDMESMLQRIEDSSACVDSCKLDKRMNKSCVNPYNSSPYKDELYENIKSEIYNTKTMKRDSVRGQICNSVSALDREKNSLAEYTKDRNMEGLKDVCVRNSYFLNVDDDLKFSNRKKEMVPSNFYTYEAGTKLSDAHNTKVGSILPKFVYKEYTP